jgi:hypothetical protein
MSEIDV